jgi:hypothetical protein
LALIHFPRPTNRTFGVVGLGVGTLAAYGQPGDTFRFYELNPAVKQLAEGFFTYLSGSPARIEIVLGDARLSLENGPPQQFDILVLDAFSGDAVPVHLLTREAFALYRRQVKADGVIAVNITNRHLDLFPVVRRLAAQFQWDAVVIKWAGPPPGRWRLPSDWLLLSRNRAFLDCAAIRQAASPMPPAWDQAPLWTDDYASLFHVLK